MHYQDNVRYRVESPLIHLVPCALPAIQHLRSVFY